MAFTFAITNYIGEQDRSAVQAQWSGGATGDSGAGWEYVEWADACVHITGTISGSTIVIQGSNDGSNWVTLNDAQGSALSFTALTSALKQIVERPRYIRPSVSGGTGSNFTVTIIARRATPLRT